MGFHKASPPLTRREALCRMGGGFGMLAFANMVSESLATAGLTEAGPSRPLDFKPRAKRVIFLFMNGGLSQVDSFDPKPALDKYHGKPFPGGSVATERKTGALMRSPFTFKKYGQCGMDVSELFPFVGECADDICFIRSMYTDIPNHEPSMLMMNTGFSQAGRPSLGSWMTYGLGTENKNLPGFVVLCPEVPTTVGPPLWDSSFLSAIHQGTFISDKVVEKQTDEKLVDPKFDPQKLVSFIHNAKFNLPEQRRELELIKKLNGMSHQTDPGVDATINSMEVAYRMQTEAPEVFDIRKESPATLKMYGQGSTARGCLMAVRLVERGVRMVQVYYAKGDPWDAHADIQAHRKNAKDSDQPFAAVIKDLKARGLFNDTLVVCGSEFGRTPVMEVGGGNADGRVQNGRDHNPFGFTMWLAGGGVKGGTIRGATDEFGFKAVEKPTHVHDLHATILYLMGIDHTKLTYRYSGRDFRLTDVHGEVIHDIIA
jgi:hypothetical protein